MTDCSNPSALAPVLFIGLVLIGCASPQEQQSYARSLSDQELCMSWMTSAPMNQYQSARVAEINRRGLNCWKYGNVNEEQRRARTDFDATVQRASGQRPAASPAQVPMGSMRCVDRGRGVLECSSPKGVQRCTSRGAGVVECD